MEVSDFYHKIYQDDGSFEIIRKEILKENNWLKDNYTYKNFKIEEHVAVSAVFHKTGDLFAVAGLWEYNKQLARTFNRTYIFPKFRARNFLGIVNNFKIGQHHILEPLDRIKTYPSTIITMQNRKGKQDWVLQWRDACFEAFKDDWFFDGAKIKTCEPEIQNCYQNFIHRGEYPKRRVIGCECFNNLNR